MGEAYRSSSNDLARKRLNALFSGLERNGCNLSSSSFFFGVLFVATLAASLVPAARAARLDPVVVLRD